VDWVNKVDWVNRLGWVDNMDMVYRLGRLGKVYDNITSSSFALSFDN
jgi:hypothetical protein